ncbi:hypothetical protein [Streptomyces sp. NK15101]|uniref:hypothetical protein n=1 Tax=Streptomyces sp. NK15101 TaxID=2873261 RepID=UPI001CED62EF|nr:hypothetical protein [Streptomyces sp. NK15101]
MEEESARLFDELLGMGILWGVVDQYVRHGLVNLEELTDREVVSTVLREFMEEADSGAAIVEGRVTWSDDDIHVVTDHSIDLLERAAEAVGAEEYWFAILFYATWLEHWANNVLMSLSVRSGVPAGVAVALVRSCSFNLKMKDVWASLGAAPIEKVHMRAMTDLMEFRNGFVHYKWQPQSISSMDAYDRRVEEVAKTAQKLVIVLEGLEDELIFLGRRAALRVQCGLVE